MSEDEKVGGIYIDIGIEDGDVEDRLTILEGLINKLSGKHTIEVDIVEKINGADSSSDAQRKTRKTIIDATLKLEQNAAKEATSHIEPVVIPATLSLTHNAVTLLKSAIEEAFKSYSIPIGLRVGTVTTTGSPVVGQQFVAGSGHPAGQTARPPVVFTGAGRQGHRGFKKARPGIPRQVAIATNQELLQQLLDEDDERLSDPTENPITRGQRKNLIAGLERKINIQESTPAGRLRIDHNRPARHLKHYPLISKRIVYRSSVAAEAAAAAQPRETIVQEPRPTVETPPAGRPIDPSEVLWPTRSPNAMQEPTLSGPALAQARLEEDRRKRLGGINRDMVGDSAGITGELAPGRADRPGRRRTGGRHAGSIRRVDSRMGPVRRAGLSYKPGEALAGVPLGRQRRTSWPSVGGEQGRDRMSTPPDLDNLGPHEPVVAGREAGTGPEDVLLTSWLYGGRSRGVPTLPGIGVEANVEETNARFPRRRVPITPDSFRDNQVERHGPDIGGREPLDPAYQDILRRWESGEFGSSELPLLESIDKGGKLTGKRKRMTAEQRERAVFRGETVMGGKRVLGKYQVIAPLTVAKEQVNALESGNGTKFDTADKRKLFALLGTKGYEAGVTETRTPTGGYGSANRGISTQTWSEHDKPTGKDEAGTTLYAGNRENQARVRDSHFNEIYQSLDQYERNAFKVAVKNIDDPKQQRAFAEQWLESVPGQKERALIKADPERYGYNNSALTSAFDKYGQGDATVENGLEAYMPQEGGVTPRTVYQARVRRTMAEYRKKYQLSKKSGFGGFSEGFRTRLRAQGSSIAHDEGYWETDYNKIGPSGGASRVRRPGAIEAAAASIEPSGKATTSAREPNLPYGPAGQQLAEAQNLASLYEDRQASLDIPVKPGSTREDAAGNLIYQSGSPGTEDEQRAKRNAEGMTDVPKKLGRVGVAEQLLKEVEARSRAIELGKQKRAWAKSPEAAALSVDEKAKEAKRLDAEIKAAKDEAEFARATLTGTWELDVTKRKNFGRARGALEPDTITPMRSIASAQKRLTRVQAEAEEAKKRASSAVLMAAADQERQRDIEKGVNPYQGPIISDVDLPSGDEGIAKLADRSNPTRQSIGRLIPIPEAATSTPTVELPVPRKFFLSGKRRWPAGTRDDAGKSIAGHSRPETFSKSYPEARDAYIATWGPMATGEAVPQPTPAAAPEDVAAAAVEPTPIRPAVPTMTPAEKRANAAWEKKQKKYLDHLNAQGAKKRKVAEAVAAQEAFTPAEPTPPGSFFGIGMSFPSPQWMPEPHAEPEPIPADAMFRDELVAQRDATQKNLSERTRAAMSEHESDVSAAQQQYRERHGVAKPTPGYFRKPGKPGHWAADQMYEGPYGAPEMQSSFGPFAQLNYGKTPDVPGSKVHVSATVAEAEKTLKIVDAVARKMGITYKFVQTKQEMADPYTDMLGEHVSDFGKGGAQQGKFITAYPQPEQAREFVELIAQGLEDAGLGKNADVAPSEVQWGTSPISHRWVPRASEGGDRYAEGGDYGPGHINTVGEPTPAVASPGPRPIVPGFVGDKPIVSRPEAAARKAAGDREPSIGGTPGGPGSEPKGLGGPSEGAIHVIVDGGHLDSIGTIEKGGGKAGGGVKADKSKPEETAEKTAARKLQEAHEDAIDPGEVAAAAAAYRKDRPNISQEQLWKKLTGTEHFPAQLVEEAIGPKPGQRAGGAFRSQMNDVERAVPGLKYEHFSREPGQKSDARIDAEVEILKARALSPTRAFQTAVAAGFAKTLGGGGKFEERVKHLTGALNLEAGFKEKQADITEKLRLNQDNEAKTQAAALALDPARLGRANSPEERSTRKKISTALPGFAQEKKELEDEQTANAPKLAAASQDVVAKRKALISPVGVARGFAFLGAGAITGGLIYGAASKAVEAAIGALGEVAAKAADQLMGFSQTTTKVTAELASAVQQSFGNVSGAVAGAAAPSGISAEALAGLNANGLSARAAAIAASHARVQESDLFRSANKLSGDRLPGGYDKALWQGTGGIGGTSFLSDTPGFMERIAGDFASFGDGTPNPARFSGPTGAGKGFSLQLNDEPATLPPTQEEVTRKTVAYADDLNKQLDKANSGFEILTDASKEQKEAMLKSATAIGHYDEAKKLADKGVAITGKGGRELTGTEIGQASEDLARGQLIVDQRVAFEQDKRGLQAQINQIGRETAWQVGTEIPRSAALQNLAAPQMDVVGGQVQATGIAPANAVEQAKLNDGIKKAQVSQTGLNSLWADGESTLKKQLNDVFHSDELFTSIKTTGAEIASIQADISDKQAKLTTHEYANQLRIAQRSLTDIAGLMGKNAAHGASTLGIIERENVMLSRQSELLGQMLQQRQINFQLAVAGFQVGGESGEERAARIKDAKTQAEFAQKQLDISKKTFGNNIKLFDLQNVRSMTDAIKSIGLLKEGRAVAFDTAVAEKNLSRLNKLQDAQVKKAGAGLAAVDKTLQLEWAQLTKMEAAYGKAVQGLAEDTMDWFSRTMISMTNDMNVAFGGAGGTTDPNTKHAPGTGPLRAAGFIGNVSGATTMTMGEAGTETVAILRNPRQATLSGGGGGGVTININHPVVRDDQDINKITASVVRAINTRTALLGLR